MSGSLPTSKPMMLWRGRRASAACARRTAPAGELVITLRSTISRIPSRRTSRETSAVHRGVTAEAQGGSGVRRGSQNVWSAESPPIRSSIGPSPCTWSRLMTRSSPRRWWTYRGTLQYSVDRPRYERGTGSAASVGEIVTVARGSGGWSDAASSTWLEIATAAKLATVTRATAASRLRAATRRSAPAVRCRARGIPAFNLWPTVASAAEAGIKPRSDAEPDKPDHKLIWVRR